MPYTPPAVRLRSTWRQEGSASPSSRKAESATLPVEQLAFFTVDNPPFSVPLLLYIRRTALFHPREGFYRYGEGVLPESGGKRRLRHKNLLFLCAFCFYIYFRIFAQNIQNRTSAPNRHRQPRRYPSKLPVFFTSYFSIISWSNLFNI